MPADYSGPLARRQPARNQIEPAPALPYSRPVTDVPSFTLAEFNTALTKERLLVQQTIHAALIAGVVLFMAVTLFLPAGDSGSGKSGLEVLMIVNAVVLLNSLWMAPFLHKQTLRAAGKGDALQCLNRIQAAGISRAVVLEGSAMLGVVVCLILKLDGYTDETPLLWLNGIPAIVFMILMSIHFPRHDVLMNLVRRNILQLPDDTSRGYRTKA